MRGPSLNLAVLLTLTVVPRWHADSDWQRPSEEQQWCNKDIGFSGECIARKDCLCLCYDLHDKKLQASAAYFGELGYELQLVAPYLYHLHAHGMLNRTAGSLGSSTWMYFSPQHQELSIPRKWCTGPPTRPSPHVFHNFDYHAWTPPPYKKHYSANSISFDKPSIIIHNKYAPEWEHSPENFLDIPTLMTLAEMLTPHYTVVYIRPGGQYKAVDTGYAADGSEGDNMPDLDDHAQLKEAHPELVMFQDLLAERPGATWNAVLMQVHVACDNYISVYGGNAVVASYFAGHNIVYASTDSIEENHWEFDVFHTKLTHKKGTVEVVKRYEDLLHRVQQAFLAPERVASPVEAPVPAPVHGGHVRKTPATLLHRVRHAANAFLNPP